MLTQHGESVLRTADTDRSSGASEMPPFNARRDPVAVHRSEDVDLLAVLSPFMSRLGAAGMILTLHHDDGDAPIVIDSLGFEMDDGALTDELKQSAQRLQERGSVAGSTPITLGWSVSHHDRHGVQALRLPVRCARARSRLVLTIVYRNAGPDRQSLITALQDLSLPIEAYLRLWQRTRQNVRAIAGFRSCLDLVDYGIVLIDRSSRVGYVNVAARHLLEEGVSIRQTGQCLTAPTLGDALKLQVAISHAIASNIFSQDGQHAAGGSSMLRLESGNASLIVSVVPCDEPAREAAATAAIVLLIRQAEDLARILQPVCKLYGLSPVEAQLAGLIAAGVSLQKAAERMRIQEQTARTYLKQIFSKSGVSRQAELVRTLLTSLPHIRSFTQVQGF